MSKGNYDAFLAAVRLRESSNNYQAYSDLKFAGAYQLGKPSLIDAGFIVHPHPNKPACGNDWENAVWTDKATKLGINNLADFLGTVPDKDCKDLPQIEQYHPMKWDPKLKKKVPNKKISLHRVQADPAKAESAIKAQDEAAKAFFAVVWHNYICNRKKCLDAYVGSTINGIKLTPSALIAGYHLVGLGYHKNGDGSIQPGLKAYLQSNGKDDGKDNNKTPVSHYIALFNDYTVPFAQKNTKLPPALTVSRPRTNKKVADKRKSNGQTHPHAAAEKGDYYEMKHWNIASRLTSMWGHGPDDGWFD